MNEKITFSNAKNKYTKIYKTKDCLEKSLVKSSGNDLTNISLVPIVPMGMHTKAQIIKKLKATV